MTMVIGKCNSRELLKSGITPMSRYVVTKYGILEGLGVRNKGKEVPKMYQAASLTQNQGYLMMLI